MTHIDVSNLAPHKINDITRLLQLPVLFTPDIVRDIGSIVAQQYE